MLNLLREYWLTCSQPLLFEIGKDDPSSKTEEIYGHFEDFIDLSDGKGEYNSLRYSLNMVTYSKECELKGFNYAVFCRTTRKRSLNCRGVSVKAEGHLSLVTTRIPWNEKSQREKIVSESLLHVKDPNLIEAF